MVKLAHRETSQDPIQIGVGTNIGVPTQTSQGKVILRELRQWVKEEIHEPSPGAPGS